MTRTHVFITITPHSVLAFALPGGTPHWTRPRLQVSNPALPPSLPALTPSDFPFSLPPLLPPSLSAFAAVLWPSVPFTVPEDRVGVAYGLTTTAHTHASHPLPLLPPCVPPSLPPQCFCCCALAVRPFYRAGRSSRGGIRSHHRHSKRRPGPLPSAGGCYL